MVPVPSRSAQTQAVIDGRIDYSSAVPPADVLPEVRAKYKDRYTETPANVSLSLSAASISEYAEMTHCRFCRLVLRS